MKLRDLLREDATEYRPPAKPEQLMADFYVLGFLSSGPVQSTSDRQDGLDFEVRHATTVLLPYLREHLLRMAGNSIASELTHTFDAARSPAQWGEYMDERAKSEYLKRLGVPDEVIRQLYSTSSGNAYGTDLLRNLGNEVNSRLAAAGSRAFRELKWVSGYGGEPWAVGCDTWTSLYGARSLGDVSVYCDKLYSIEHNNGAFLNKNIQYTGNWVKQLLDIKFKAREPEELIEFTSPWMRRLAQKVLRSRYGRSMDQHDPGVSSRTALKPIVVRLDNEFTTSVDDDYITVYGGPHNDVEAGVVWIAVPGQKLSLELSNGKLTHYPYDEVDTIIDDLHNYIGATSREHQSA